MHKNQMSLETYEKVSDSYYDADENSHLPVHIAHLINLSNACRKHKCSMSDYQIAHKMYGKGGTIGDSVIIEDKNSVYFGKIGTIVGEVENTYVIKTINGTGIAKKSKVKLVKSDKDYAKGGSVGLENKIKGKLNKSFSLPYEMAIYVPSTYGADQEISTQEFKKRISQTELFLSNLFGGFSKTDIDGGYVSEQKGLIAENVAKVTSFATEENLESNLNKLVSKISDWCDEWGQESMGFEFEGDLFYIEKGFKFRRGGMTKKEYVGKKVGQVMHEFKQRNLHSGTSGKIVKKRKQAVAIALNIANEGWKHKRK